MWHACAITVGAAAAVCLGEDVWGALNAPPGAFRQVSAGARYACAVAADDTLACWGGTEAGAGTPPAGKFRQVSTSREFSRPHTCGVREDGSLACWGSNSDGQTNVPPGTFTQVSVGGRFTCAIRSDDRLACWGEDSHRQTGAPAGTFKEVSAGGEHACGITLDDRVACWGSDEFFQRTIPGTPTPTPTPTPVVTAMPSPTPVASPIPTPRPRVRPAATPPLFGSSNAVVKLPTTRRCASRRHFKIHIRERAGFTIARATVSLNGKRVRTFKRTSFRCRKHAAMVDLRGLPKGKFTVRIVVTATDGRVLRGSRTYRTCALRG